MKLRRSLATATVALVGLGSLLTSMSPAHAATVEVTGDQCAITFTWQDMTDLKTEIRNSDPDGLARVKAAIPGIDQQLDVLKAELASQIATTGDVDLYALSPAGDSAWYAYLIAGSQQGFSVNDLAAMLISTVVPDLLAAQITLELGDQLVGTQVLSKAQAQDRIGKLGFIWDELKIAPESSVYFGVSVSPRASEVVKPSLDSLDVFADVLSQPFEDCVNSRPVEEEPPVNTGGGSSFGSS